MRFRTKVMAFQAAILAGLLLVIAMTAYVALRFAIPEMRAGLEVRARSCLRTIMGRADVALATEDPVALAALREACHRGGEVDPDLAFLAVFDVDGGLHVGLGNIPDGLRPKTAADSPESGWVEGIYRSSGRVDIEGLPLGFVHVGYARDRFDQAASAVFWVTALSLFLALAALGLSGYFANRHIVVHLEAQLAFLEQVSRGNLDARLDLRTGDERDRLVEGMNLMASELKTSLVSIDKLNRTNTDLEHAHHQLRETQAKLVQTGKLAALGELSAGLAHELNQPLTAIRGFSQLLEEDLEAGRMPSHRAVERILKASSRMSAIVQNVRAFAGGARQQIVRVPADAPVVDALALVSEQLRLHGIRLGVEVETGLPNILADRAQIQQVVLNLLGNARDALDTTTEGRGKQIKVQVFERDEHVCYAVEDNGPGIPVEHHDKLFEPFFTTKAPGVGMGLGLSLSHGIVRDHDGSIELETPTEGGARFVVRIPAASTAELKAYEQTEEEEARESSQPELQTPSGRVLLVENEEDVREILRRVCLRAGHHVDEAEDGDSALRHLESTRYDVVLTDLHVPGASGMAVLRTVRKRGDGTWVILMSTLADGEPADGGDGSGAFALLRKPFEDLAEVSTVIGRAMEKG